MTNMTNPGITLLEKCVDDKCRYTLVIMAAKRARMIADGAKSISSEHSSKPVSEAIDEIAEGRVKYKRISKPKDADFLTNLNTSISADDLDITE